MVLTQFIDSHIRNEVNLFLSLPDIKILCSIYGCQAFNKYIVDSLQFKTYDIDIIVTNPDNISNITEIIGCKLIAWLNTKLGHELSRLFPNTLFNLSKTCNHLNVKNTVKIFVGNKPLIDISECDRTDIELNKIYPDINVENGYRIKSLEWLIMNLINILKDRTVSNNHIWEKCKQRAERILFILAHKPSDKLIFYKFHYGFHKNIALLKKIIKYAGDVYYSSDIHETKCMELSEIEQKLHDSNYMLKKKLHKLESQKAQKIHLSEQNEQLRNSMIFNSEEYTKLKGTLEEKIRNLELDLDINLRKNISTKQLMDRLQLKVNSIERKNKILSSGNSQLLDDNRKYREKYVKLKERYSTFNLSRLVSNIEMSYKDHIQSKFTTMTDLIKQMELQITRLNGKLEKSTSGLHKSDKHTKILLKKDSELLKKDRELQKKEKELIALRESEKTTKSFCKRKIIECSKLTNDFGEKKRFIEKYLNEFLHSLKHTMNANEYVRYESIIEELNKKIGIILS